MFSTRTLSRYLVFCLVPVLVLSACDDPFLSQLEPLIATDTVELAIPTAVQTGLPSALDITALGGLVRGGRFPERADDADLGWDLTVRIRDGQIVFVPSSALGFPLRAGISAPIAGQTFDGLREVPAGLRFETETPTIAQLGAVYAARSREFSAGFVGSCVQYAKLQVLELDVAAGTIRVLLATNERCHDTRLVPAGS